MLLELQLWNRDPLAVFLALGDLELWALKR